jgi:hypothetical protein
VPGGRQARITVKGGLSAEQGETASCWVRSGHRLAASGFMRDGILLGAWTARMSPLPLFRPFDPAPASVTTARKTEPSGKAVRRRERIMRERVAYYSPGGQQQ